MGCLCFQGRPPCGWCESLTEEEADIQAREGSEGVERYRARADGDINALVAVPVSRWTWSDDEYAARRRAKKRGPEEQAVLVTIRKRFTTTGYGWVSLSPPPARGREGFAQVFLDGVMLEVVTGEMLVDRGDLVLRPHECKMDPFTVTFAGVPAGVPLDMVYDVEV